ncbi:hypothetical protein LCGC14_1961530 [marine sediment metagenome]|uniref:Uncharacterized protein n=1 Tax=marine sediment metagenome TaxID=412755 RepID=A0A0F9HSW7_9ZZZZ
MSSTGNVTYGAASHVNARGPSPSIWADCPVNAFLKNPGKGSHMFDDFRNSILKKEEAARGALTDGIGELHGDMKWNIYAESALIADIALQADDIGVLMIDTDGNDDDTYGITGGDNVQGVWRSPKVGETKKFWFEARLKVSTITNTDISAFFGLMEPGKLGNGTPLGAAPTAPGNFDYFGFFIAEADGDDLTLVQNEPGAGSAQSVTGQITLVANTYIRIGMKLVIDGNSIKLRYYADGVDLGEDAAIDIGSTNANWPGNTNMDLIFTLTSGATGENGDNIKIDWVRIAQEF